VGSNALLPELQKVLIRIVQAHVSGQIAPLSKHEIVSIYVMLPSDFVNIIVLILQYKVDIPGFNGRRINVEFEKNIVVTVCDSAFDQFGQKRFSSRQAVPPPAPLIGGVEV
jgi:hypothetical protein